MFKGDAYYNLSKEEKLTQSIKYIASYLVNLAKDDVGNVIGITSSLPYKNSKKEVCKEICGEIGASGSKLMFVDLSSEKGKESNKSDNCKEIYISECDVNDFKSLITNEKQKYGIILVNIPPISAVAESIEYAKVCGRVILLERYMYTTYQEYEETLIKLKIRGVRVDGVITYN